MKNNNPGRKTQALRSINNEAVKGDVALTDEFALHEVEESLEWVVWYFRRLAQAAEIYSKELAKKHLVSQPQLSCLLALHNHGSLPISKLAQYILVKPSTVTGIVDRLEKKGLVKRERKGSDRRVITIELTEAGSQLATVAPPPIPRSIFEALNKRPPHEVKEIVKSLAALVHMLDEEHIDEPVA